MNTFTEVFESIEQDSRICDMTTRKTNIYLDALYREYAINCEEAELKILKESGTADDLVYLCEEATDGLIKKTIDGIKKIFDAVVQFIKNLVKKISEFLTGKSVNDAVDKMEDAIEKNPELGKAKVEIPNMDADDKWYQKALAKLKSLLAKIKGGNTSDSIIDESDEIRAELEKRKKKGAIVAGVTTVTLAAAILMIKKFNKGGINDPSLDTKEIDNLADDACKAVEAAGSADAARNIKDVSTTVSVVCKNRAIAKTDGISETLRSAGNTFKKFIGKLTGKAGKATRIKGLKESAMDDSYLDSILGYQNDDVDSLFDSIVESVNSDDSFSIMDSIDAIF